MRKANREAFSHPIDVSFDAHSDAGGHDPDSHSLTLRRYHRLLWSKPLPNGSVFVLDEWLNHKSDLGEFSLSSDAFLHTYSKWKRYQHVINQVPQEELDEFIGTGWTIGQCIVFPSNRIDGKSTINAARGWNRSICDRFDLTLECIRRHYAGEGSPLSVVLERYHEFFALFKDFRGYVEFFLLQDLVSDDFREICFFLPFEGFGKSALPADVEEYLQYKKNSLDFLRKRSRRIEEWARGLE